MRNHWLWFSQRVVYYFWNQSIRNTHSVASHTHKLSPIRQSFKYMEGIQKRGLSLIRVTHMWFFGFGVDESFLAKWGFPLLRLRITGRNHSDNKCLCCAGKLLKRGSGFMYFVWMRNKGIFCDKHDLPMDPSEMI